MLEQKRICKNSQKTWNIILQVMVVGEWSGLKEIAEYSKAIGETLTASKMDLFFACFLVQTGHCTRCSCNATHSREFARLVITPDALA